MRHALALAVVFCSSCATILDGGPDVLNVTSQPEGAAVHLRKNGKAMDMPAGKTPTQIAVPRTDVDGLELRFDDFHAQQIDLVHDVNGWVFGNIIFGGAIGILIDLTTGNSTRLSTDAALHVVLVPTSRPAPACFRFPPPPRETYRPASTQGPGKPVVEGE